MYLVRKCSKCIFLSNIHTQYINLNYSDNILDRLKVLQAETGRDDSLSYLYGPPVNPISSPSELRNRMPPPYVEDGPASSG